MKNHDPWKMGRKRGESCDFPTLLLGEKFSGCDLGSEKLGWTQRFLWDEDTIWKPTLIVHSTDYHRGESSRESTQRLTDSPSLYWVLISSSMWETSSRWKKEPPENVVFRLDSTGINICSQEDLKNLEFMDHQLEY